MTESITYKGDPRFMGLCSSTHKDVKPEHKNYRSAPSRFLELTDGTQLHIIAYNTPKSGIVIRLWVKREATR